MIFDRFRGFFKDPWNDMYAKRKKEKKWHENSLLHPRDDNNYHFSDGLPFFSRWSQSAFKTECEENGGKRQIILKTQNCVEKSYFESPTRF